MKLGDVGLLHCPCCNEATSVALATKDGPGELSDKMVDPNPCEKCQEVMKNNVTFHCDCCDGFQTIKLAATRRMGLKAKAGQNFKIHQCTECSGDHRLVLWPPEMEQKIKQELEQKKRLKQSFKFKM